MNLPCVGVVAAPESRTVVAAFGELAAGSGCPVDFGDVGLLCGDGGLLFVVATVLGVGLVGVFDFGFAPSALSGFDVAGFPGGFSVGKTIFSVLAILLPELELPHSST